MCTRPDSAATLSVAGIDADHRVAAAVEQAVDDRGGDALQVVGRMVGLQAHRRAGPGRPIVLRKRVTTRHLRATRIRSWLRISLQTAAAISGVMPGAHRGERGFVGGIRQQPVAELADGQVRDRRERGGVVAVDDQARDLVALVGDQRLVEEALAAAHRPGTCAPPSAPRRWPAATPASTSPERSGVALAITSLRSRNCQQWLPIVWR